MATTTSTTDERAIAAAALDAAEEELQALCVSHAGTFVSVERRARDLRQHVQELLDNIGSVSKLVENSDLLSQEQETNLSELSERHRVRRRTLLQHSGLLNLLELPQIMDACVRSSLYEEALQISNFANTLSRRHGKTGIIHQVILQIRNRQLDLRRHLLARLQRSVTMPECLEVVTALRRLNAIDLEASNNLEKTHNFMEYQLQVDFLEARDYWLDSKSSSGSSRAALLSSSHHHEESLLDAIERYRTRVFEVATQFNAIFRAQATTTNTATTTSSNQSSTELLNLWMSRRVLLFMHLLQHELTNDAAAIRDALEASIFFANSMGRLGADFTGQLPGIFEPILLETVTQFWKDAVAQLQETLTICRDAGVAGPLTSDMVTTTDDDAASSDKTMIPLEDPQPAPKQLLALPPLARLVNGVLTGLNELRRCLLPGIFPALRASLEEQLKIVANDLLANERAVMTPGFRGEAAELRRIAAALRETFAEICEPYLRGSLEAAIGYRGAAAKQHNILRENIAKQQVQEDDQTEEENNEKKPDEEEQEEEQEKRGGSEVQIEESLAAHGDDDGEGHLEHDSKDGQEVEEQLVYGVETPDNVQEQVEGDVPTEDYVVQDEELSEKEVQEDD